MTKINLENLKASVQKTAATRSRKTNVDYEEEEAEEELQEQEHFATVKMCSHARRSKAEHGHQAFSGTPIGQDWCSCSRDHHKTRRGTHSASQVSQPRLHAISCRVDPVT